MIGVWYHNFFGAESYTLLPYDQVLFRLRKIPTALRQILITRFLSETDFIVEIDWYELSA